MKWKIKIFLLFVVLLVVRGKVIKGKKAALLSKTGSSLQHKESKKSSHVQDVHTTDKKAARSKVYDSTLQELIKDPQKLDTDEMQQVKMLDFYNSKFMNSELASESQMLINQGIDADSARKIATMDRVPGISGGRKSSNGMENGVSKDSFSTRLGMDISRWPEYHIRDSGGYHIATTTDNKPGPQYISSAITDDDRQIDEGGNNPNMGMGGGQDGSELSMHHGGFKGLPEESMMGAGHESDMMDNMFNGGKQTRPSMDMYSGKQMGHAHLENMYGEESRPSAMHGGGHHMNMGMKGGFVGQGHVRSKEHRHHHG